MVWGVFSTSVPKFCDYMEWMNQNSRDSLPGVLSLSKIWLLVQGESCLSLVSCVGPDI